MMVRRILTATASVLILAGSVPRPATAQEPHPRLQIPQHAAPRQDWRVRLNRVDQLTRLGSLGRAATLLEQLESSGAPRDLVIPVRVRLAEARGEHEEVVALCEEGLALRNRSPRLLRSYAASLMVLGRDDEARRTVTELVAGTKNKISVLVQAVNLWRAAGRPDEGLALCDSLRTAQDAPDLLRRSRAACLLDLDRVDEGVGELAAELAANPLNVALVRDEVLAVLDGEDAVRRAVESLGRGVPEAASTPAALLEADLLLRLGRDAEAVEVVRPLLDAEADRAALLRSAGALLREAPVLENVSRRDGVYRWLLTVLESLASAPPPSGRPTSLRIFDMLAQAALQALESGLDAADGGEGVRRVDRALTLLRARTPGSTRLYAAQVLLARHTRDVLRRPREAAERLELLFTDLDLPLQGLALCRLELGRCYLADADTLRARRVLTRLGRDGQFPVAAGPAHFLLARLDLAQGHWEEARDRLAAVALDDPRADHANDALDLALLLAVELPRRETSPDLFDAFAENVTWDLLDRPDLRRTALERMLGLAVADTALLRSSDLPSRGRLELADLLGASGEPLAAAVLCGAVVRDRPDGPHAAAALEGQGTWYLASGDPVAARRCWERLLAQYPDAVVAEETRLRLRELP